jgi:outer membrane murein-binding lipoprotein Lpp
MPFFRLMLSLRRIAIPALCALGLAGCVSRGNVEILESELRTEERAREELAEQLRQSHEELKIARTDAAALRSQLTERRQVALSPEQADVFYRAEAIKFNMLLTSGQERDGQSGDDSLSVMLMPVDVHGDLVKLAGDVELELFDMTLASDQQRLGLWRFNLDEVREHWHKGFLAAGYLFQMDWQTPPVSPELTLHARMTVADGRQFDATTQLKITPKGGVAPPLVPGAPHRSRDISAKRTSASRPVIRAGTTDASADARPILPEPGDAAAEPATPGPVIRPCSKIGHATLPTKTSDTWTEATIPTLR